MKVNGCDFYYLIVHAALVLVLKHSQSRAVHFSFDTWTQFAGGEQVICVI